MHFYIPLLKPAKGSKDIFTIFAVKFNTMDKESKMPKVGTIAYHEWHIKRIRSMYSKKAKEQHARKRAQFKEGYDNTAKITVKDPPARYRSRIDYDFLKYIRIIFKWASENYPDLTRPQIEFLLYLYGVGAFSKKQFNDYHRLLGLYAIKTLQKFLDEGWIKVWRVRKGKEYALYTLTHKSKIMCNSMHKFACGLEEIPMNMSANRMARKDAPRINNYYLDMIKRMNKDKSPKE